MFSKLQLYAAAGLAFILALFGIYLRGKSDGVEAERNKLSRDNLDSMRQAKEVRDEIMDDPYYVDRARRKWLRSDDDKR